MAERCARRAPAEGMELKRTIFYIDDEAVCLDLFHEVFGDEYDVRMATTLAEARRALTERPADPSSSAIKTCPKSRARIS